MMIPKSKAYRNEKYKQAVRQLSCSVCGAWGVQAAHANLSEFGKGLGLKASDATCVPLCVQHHGEIDNGTVYSKAEIPGYWYHHITKTFERLSDSGLITALPKMAVWTDGDSNRGRAHQLVRAMENGEIEVKK
jgi:hypothetical protein